MKYDLSTTLKTYNNKPIQTGSDSSDLATLRFVLEQACVSADPQKHASGDEKFKIYKLLQKMQVEEAEIEFDASEVTLLKTLVGEIFTVTVVGAVYDLLEQKH